MNMLTFIQNVLGINNEPTGADAVVTDYVERQNLADRQKETTAVWDSVERIADDGFFNSVTECNIHFNLGEYGDMAVTLNLEDELPEFMDDLNLDVEDLQMLVSGNYEIPVIREGGEWRIKWEEIQDWELYSESGE